MKSTMVSFREKTENLKRTRLPSFRVPDNVAVSVNQANFSWDGKKDSIAQLQIDNLSIPLGIYSSLFLKKKIIVINTN
jgi:hypothetical protein